MKKILFSIVMLFFASCAHAEWQQVPSRGLIKNGIYHDPAKMFQIALPNMGEGKMIVDDEMQDGASHVFFTDNTGELYRVEAVHIPDSLFLEICANGMGEREQLRSFFEAAVLGPLEESGKKATILFANLQKTVNLGQVHYSVFYIPNGSHLIDTQTEVRPNCLRAYMVKVTADQIIIFTYQPTLQMQEKFQDMTLDQVNTALEKKLLAFARSYAKLG